MEPITSNSLNIIEFNVDRELIFTYKFLNYSIEPKLIICENDRPSDLMLKWSFSGVDKSQKSKSFNFIVEDAYGINNAADLNIHNVRKLVHKSLNKVTIELKAQMARFGELRIDTPSVIEESVISKIYNLIVSARK